MLVERVAHNGMLVISELVSADGESWLETQKYLGYTEAEAVELFKKHLAAKGYEVPIH